MHHYIIYFRHPIDRPDVERVFTCEATDMEEAEACLFKHAGNTDVIIRGYKIT